MEKCTRTWSLRCVGIDFFEFKIEVFDFIQSKKGMSSKAQKELERQEEHKESTALPTLETTQAMSIEEKRTMRGMVVWNVAAP